MGGCRLGPHIFPFSEWSVSSFFIFLNLNFWIPAFCVGEISALPIDWINQPVLVYVKEKKTMRNRNKCRERNIKKMGAMQPFFFLSSHPTYITSTSWIVSEMMMNHVRLYVGLWVVAITARWFTRRASITAADRNIFLQFRRPKSRREKNK